MGGDEVGCSLQSPRLQLVKEPPGPGSSFPGAVAPNVLLPLLPARAACRARFSTRRPWAYCCTSCAARASSPRPWRPSVGRTTSWPRGRPCLWSPQSGLPTHRWASPSPWILAWCAAREGRARGDCCASAVSVLLGVGCGVRWVSGRLLFSCTVSRLGGVSRPSTLTAVRAAVFLFSADAAIDAVLRWAASGNQPAHQHQELVRVGRGGRAFVLVVASGDGNCGCVWWLWCAPPSPHPPPLSPSTVALPAPPPATHTPCALQRTTPAQPLQGGDVRELQEPPDHCGR
jgi:hypothetical protein